MKTKLKEVFVLLTIPFVLLVTYLLMYVVWQFAGLPSDDEMLPIVKGWFAEYGLWIVFVSALIEGFLFLGTYFPGGLIIFLGVISAGDSVQRATEVVGVVCVAFFISYTLNYWVGRYGWYTLLLKLGLGRRIEESKVTLTKHGTNALFFTYWEPNLATLTATAAGILQVPFKKFSLYSGICIVVWSSFWGILVFMLGESALQIVGLKWVLIIFCVWVTILLLKRYVLGGYLN